MNTTTLSQFSFVCLAPFDQGGSPNPGPTKLESIPKTRGFFLAEYVGAKEVTWLENVSEALDKSVMLDKNASPHSK